MKFSLTKFLIDKYAFSDQDLADEFVRSRYGYLEGWVSLIVNLVLFIIKLALGVFSGSISIIADAVHTVSDVVTSAIVIIGAAISKKPADAEHPFGHGRMENIATLIIAVLVCVIGFELLHVAIIRFSEPTIVKGNMFIIGLLTVSVLAKEWLARFSFYLSKKINSSMLYADAWHHRSDAISTLLVIVAIFGSIFRLFKLDAVFGGVVAAYIIYTGIRLIQESSFYLLGKAVDKQLHDRIKTIAQSVDGVEGVHDIIAHDYGNLKAISLHVEVSSRLDSITAHQIATTVETNIAKNIKSSPIVHIDLKKKRSKRVSATHRTFKKIIPLYPQIINFHAIDIASNESGDFLNLHIVVSKVMNIEQSHELEHKLRYSLKKHFRGYKISVHIEPCDSKCQPCAQPCKQTE